MIIIGAGGHAKDLLCIIDKTFDLNNLFFFDDVGPANYLYNYQVLKSLNSVIEKFSQIGNCDYALGLGGRSRATLMEKFQKIGGNPISIISKQAHLGSYDVQLGIGLNIMRNVFISNSVKVGDFCLINHGVSLHHDVQIGEFCEISPMAQILGHVTLGKDCFVGAGAIILPGVSVGNSVIIGAGAIVNKNVRDNTTVYGVPASEH